MIFFSLFANKISLYSQEFTPTYYTAKDGIAQGHHGYILQDFQGNIWTTSQGGLTKFDGQEFDVINYDYTHNRILNINEQSPIFQSKDSLLWIGSFEGLYMYDAKKDIFKFWGIDSTNTDGPAVPELTEIIEVNDTLWISCYAGLYSFSYKSGKWAYYDPMPDTSYMGRHHSVKSIRSIVRDKYDDNILWLGGMSRLYKFDTNKKKYVENWDIESFNNNFSNSTFAILQNSPDGFFLGTYGPGLIYFDTGTNKSTLIKIASDILIQNKTFSIIRDLMFIDSSKILGTNYSGSLFTYDIKSKSVNYLNDINVKNKSFKVTKDSDNNIWVASANGITKLNPKTVQFYEPNIPGKKYDILFSQYNPYDNSFLSYMMDKKLVYETFSKTKGKMTFRIIKHIEQVKDFALDTITKSFLILGKNGIYSLPKNSTVPKEYIKLPDNHFSTIFSTKKYIYLWNRTKIEVYNPRTLKMVKRLIAPKITYTNTNVYPEDFYILNDTIYYKSDHQIGKFNKNGDYKILLNDSNKVILEYIIVDNNCFVTTKKGLFKYVLKNNIFVRDKAFENPYKSQELKQITKVNNVIYMNNHSGLVGYNFQTNQKVLKIDERNNLDWVSGFSYYNNKLYGNTTKNYFTIDLNTNNAKVHDINIKELLISNFKTEYPVESNLELLHNQNSIYIKWAAIYFGDQDNIDYSYKLDGGGQQWINTGNSNTISFNNLNSGHYNLLVKANTFDKEFEKTILKFDIKAPWWKKWWFFTLTAFLIITAIYFFNKIRVNQIRTKSKYEQELAELELNALRAQMNPHFIFNSLNSIKRLIQKNDSDNAIDYLTNFSLLIRQILSNSDKKLISLKDEIEFSKRYLEMEKLRFRDKFTYHINIDKNLDLSSIMIPPLILQPYIENSLWHGIMHNDKSGTLNINILEYPDFVEIEIDDDGIGRKKAKEISNKVFTGKKSRGLALSEKRGELAKILYNQDIKIEIIDKIENGVANGTKVVIRIFL